MNINGRTVEVLLGDSCIKYPGRQFSLSSCFETELTRRINDDFAYDPTATDIATPVQQVMRERRGVCQDFAHVQIGALRSLGLAARYVSGYLRTYPPPGQPRWRLDPDPEKRALEPWRGSAETGPSWSRGAGLLLPSSGS